MVFVHRAVLEDFSLSAFGSLDNGTQLIIEIFNGHILYLWLHGRMTERQIGLHLHVLAFYFADYNNLSLFTILHVLIIM